MEIVSPEEAVFQEGTKGLIQKLVPVISGEPVSRTLAASCCIIIGCAHSLAMPKERLIAMVGDLWDRQATGGISIVGGKESR